MAQQLADRQDIDFVIWEQLNGEDILKSPGYSEYNRKTCDMIVTEARALALKEMLPTLAEGDKQGIRFEEGRVKVPDSFHHVHKLLLEGEWANLRVSLEMGGQGAPAFATAAAYEYIMAANWALFTYGSTCVHAAELIYKYGTPEQKKTYLKNMVSGKWGGTMQLTEPDAGTDVGALKTSAKRNPDGTFSLTGNKIFITNGEHDLSENIIHPVLARIEGDPEGTKGISIFIVPKFFVNDDGTLGEQNDIVCDGVEDKHGIKGSATCSMVLGGKGRCIGYLLGEERQGMKIMFLMMNNARMSTGFQAMSYASAAYLLALNYSRERIQGKDFANIRDPSAPSVPIIHHPDVRRNLLWMRSLVCGMRSFYYYVSMLGTKAQTLENEEERQFNSDLFELFTPLIKGYLADFGYEVCVQGMQVFGGAGYTKDYLAEQYVRDCKIVSIYEGTSGLQSMDLLGRKMGMKNGKVFSAFLDEIRKCVASAGELEDLKVLSIKVKSAADLLGEVVIHLGKLTNSPDFKNAFAYSLPFLHAMGDTILGWMHLFRAEVAMGKMEGANKKDLVFYEGQIKTAEFFIRTVLPVSKGKMNAILDGCTAAVDIPADAFGGL